ncbi:MAG TPA: prephenate dehydrogenase/arogenate dehydrogenase family protein [Gemmatimonadales bacterium]|nr:prephenate dehydrogenase/arogenate dehydrogenase family protein [Gemmatimonadales bacterium]
MRPHSLAVIGLGAIGGSLAWQARLAGVASVIGYSPDRNDSVQALKARAVHDIADSPARAVQGADLVVLAAPPQAILDLLASLAPHLGPETLVTDVASIKGPVVARAREAGLEARFAGSHPFTGTHVAGWSGARPDRFTDAIVYVCSSGAAGDRAAREVMNFWSSVLGAHPVLVEAATHDQQLAWTSHLPQAVASALAHVLSSEPSLRGASFGSGMRDTTRLAASPAEMWVDIFLMNSAPVQEALGRMEGELARLRELLARGDRPGLYALLEESAVFRRRLEGGGESGAAPAGS